MKEEVNMSKPFGWAFIGAGTLGAKVAKEITASGRHRIVSVYVRNPEKRASFAEPPRGQMVRVIYHDRFLIGMGA